MASTITITTPGNPVTTISISSSAATTVVGAGAGEEIEIGYWNIRGLAAPLRMMCEYAGVKYKDVQFDDFAKYSERKAVLKEKNPLVNLPYIVDGDVVVSQSNSCLQYLGAKLGLDAKDTTSVAYLRNSQALHEIFDLRNATVDLVYAFGGKTRDLNEFKENTVKFFEKSVPATCAKLEGFLKVGGTPMITGTTPASSDFHIFEILDQAEKLAAASGRESVLADFPLLKALHETFKGMPQLQEYFAGPQYALPCNNKLAKAYFV